MAGFFASFIILSILGAINAGYLVIKHYTKKPLMCGIGKCEIVTESKWSKIFYFRNDTLGLLFYIFLTIAVSSIYFFNLQNIFYLTIIIITGLVLSFSAFLVYLQFYIIKEKCIYCLFSAIINLLLFINSFALQRLY